MHRLSYLVITVLVSASACGNSEGGTYVAAGGSAGTGGGSAGASAGSSNAGKGGSGGASGAAGSINSGGNAGSGGAAATCPDAAPTDGASCAQAGLSCFYENCQGAGRSLAQCVGSSWSVQVEDCATFPCGGGETCMAGQVCSVLQGGAYIGTCEDNPCGTGPVTCECVNPGCGFCNVTAYAGSGITITCNTCPQGGCP